MLSTTRQLVDRLLKGDRRALARLMTYIDNRHEDVLAVMDAVSPKTGAARIIGITGPPGAGKSTLVDKLITRYRKLGKTVGVIAVDPSSPFSGGAVLGDRIRMQEHGLDEGVFIRSLGSRGAHGGLSRATADIVHLMDASGFGVILIETVGVGQTELDIMAVAQTTVVVLVPESGDTIQTMKAGLMEIADIFVVNKSDRDGADKIFHELKSLAHIAAKSDWEVPVIKTAATKDRGVDEVARAIADHEPVFRARHAGDERDKILKSQCLEILAAELTARLENIIRARDDTRAVYEKVGALSSPYQGALEMLRLLMS